jgi:hypothetical protein
MWFLAALTKTKRLAQIFRRSHAAAGVIGGLS